MQPGTNCWKRSAAVVGCWLLGWTSAWAAHEAASIPPPLISPRGGVFVSNVLVILTCSTGELRFTLDGSVPGTNSPVFSAPVLLSNSCFLQARAFAPKLPASETAAETFTLSDTGLVQFSSSLPLVIIQTFGHAIQPETNTPVSIRLLDVESGRRAGFATPANFDGRATVKVRGYTSRRYPKKSLALETRDAADQERAVPLLGLPADSEWVLYAPYPDKSLLRDALAYELSNQMGRYASRTRFVEVFLNESTNRLAPEHYAGIYVLEEKIKSNEHRVKLQKLSPNDNAEPAITGGYMFKKDHLEKVNGDEPPAPAPAATANSKPGRVGFPTGPGGFPADPPGFLPPREDVLLVTNIVTLTNVTPVTNVVTSANVTLLTNVVATTNVVAVTNVAWLTNAVTATNVTTTQQIRSVTNVVSVTNAASATNVVAVPNVAPFPGAVGFTNVAAFTNVATFTNVASITNATAVTNLVAATRVLAITNVASITNVAALTNVASATNLVITSTLAVVTNLVSLTNITALTNSTLATASTNGASKKPPVLARLVETGQGFVTTRTNAFFYVEPKGAHLTAAQRAWLSNHLNQFEQALYGPNFRDPTRGYAPFIDADSFIDHHLIVEATKNIDGFRFSTFYSKDRGGRITMGPIWDWNLSLGNAAGKQGGEFDHWYWPQLDDRQYSWFRRLFDDPDFAQRYVDRWGELRASVFATSNVCARVDAWAALLQEPAARNFTRWPILGQVINTEPFTGKTYAEEIQYLKTWVTNRLAWMTAQFLAPPSIAPVTHTVHPGTSLVLTAPVGRIYFTLDGSDPRLPGGGVSPAARPFDQPIPIVSAINVFSRAQQGQRWSSPARARIAVQPTQTAKGR